MGYTPSILTIHKYRWNNPLILTIDPNFQRDIQAPLERTQNNLPSQLWKESLYCLLVKVWGRVPVRCVETTLDPTWRTSPVSKWLITMVSKSPKWGYSPYKWPKWLVNRGTNHLLTGMILQEKDYTPYNRSLSPFQLEAYVRRIIPGRVT